MRLIIFLLIAAACGWPQTAGQPLPPWSPGTFDIHQIDTGRGNAALWVLPDGTTVLLDAGGVPDKPGLELGPRRPNADVSTADAIASYVRQFGGRTPASLDYAIATHFHQDHMAALATVATKVPVKKLIDRGPDPAAPTYEDHSAYFKWRSATGGETIRVGAANQIVSQAKDFEVRNIAGNGLVWTGSAERTATRVPANWRQFPPTIQPTENHFSLAFRIRYGKFDYFTGGDLPGVRLDGVPEWHDMETPVAQAVGAVDVTVLNHHGWLDTTNETFLDTLQPRVVVIPAWHATHPDHSVLRRLRSPQRKPAPPDLFITSLLEAPKVIFKYLRDPFKSTEGHVLIRVAPGGGKYQVIILDSQQVRPTVKAVFGPYESK